MREIHTSGSEGGVPLRGHSYPYLPLHPASLVLLFDRRELGFSPPGTFSLHPASLVLLFDRDP